MPKKRDYKIRNVVKAVLGNLWTIMPEKLEEIVALLEARSEGIVPSETELFDRFGSSSAADPEDGPLIKDGIQVIDVTGTLAPKMNLMSRFSGGTSTQKLAKELNEAADNELVRSVILYVDSPGGAYSYTPEAAEAVRSLAAKKRVVTSATNSMASGAYWIGSAATEAFASESTSVGSIGVYSVLSNVKKAAEMEGVKFHVFRGGKLKAAGLKYEDLTDERRRAIQGTIDSIYQDFLAAVAEHREASVETVESTFGQGTTFFGAEAEDRGMIDGVATFEEVFDRERMRVQRPSQSRAISIEGGNMNTRVKAALLARGLIKDMDVSDDVAKSVLETFCKSTGISIEGLSDDQIAEKVMAHQTATATVNEPDRGSQTADDDGDGKPPTRSEIREAAQQERTRITDLQTRGALLGVSQDDIQAAIEEGTSVEDALIQWTDKKADSQRPINRLDPSEAQVDKVESAASAILLQRCGFDLSSDEREAMSSFGGSLQRRRLIDIIRASQSSRGVSVSYDDYEDAKQFLSTPGPLLASSSTSVNRRGDHPDLLSALTRKALTQGAEVAQVTYPQWCQRIEDLPDFKPKSFIDTGIFHRLDAISEDQEPKQFKMQSELRNWIKADRYAGQAGLTIEMVVDDDLGGFVRILRSMRMASAQTVNGVILDLFVSNPIMLDGNAFFSNAHNNLISSGAAPSASQFVEHRKLHRLQKSFGSEHPMGMTFDRILVPVEHEDAALRATTRLLDENKTPNTDTNINTFRGQVSPIVESYLDDFDTNSWYSLLNPMAVAAVVYAFQTGFGEDGREEEYTDPKTGTRYVKIETRFGAAMANWRAMVKNPGQ